MANGNLILTRRIGEGTRIGTNGAMLRVKEIRSPKHIWPSVVAVLTYKGKTHEVITGGNCRLADDIKVEVLERSNRQTLRLGFNAPREINIVREEVEKRNG